MAAALTSAHGNDYDAASAQQIAKNSEYEREKRPEWEQSEMNKLELAGMNGRFYPIYNLYHYIQFYI